MEAKKLKDIRESFHLNLLKASIFIGGGVDVQEWVAYESGLIPVPGKVSYKAREMVKRRLEIADNLFDKLHGSLFKTIKTYNSKWAYLKDNKGCTELDYIIYGSIVKNLKNNRNEYIYK